MITEKSPFLCRVCGGSDVQELLYPCEMMFGMRDKFIYFRCATCSCLQIAEVPGDLGKYYPANYYSYQDVQDVPVSLGKAIKLKFLYPSMTKDKLRWGSVIGRMFCLLGKGPPIPDWLYFLARPVSSNDRILDVGCGSGINLLALRNCGFKNLSGIDPFISKPLTYHGGIQIDKCELKEVQGKFDLIMFHHVFEHLENPLEVIQNARRLLTGKGQILIRIPISDSVAAEKYKEKWVQLDAPRHITLQTRKSMKIIAKKAELKITRIVYDSFDFQFWGSEQYLLDIPLFDPRSHNANLSKGLFSKEQIIAFAEESQRLNKTEKGDQAAFVLEAAKNS